MHSMVDQQHRQFLGRNCEGRVYSINNAVLIGNYGRFLCVDSSVLEVQCQEM